MAATGSSTAEQSLRAAELVAALSLATDVGTGLQLEHGLDSACVAMRLCERLSLDPVTASDAYYASLLFYIGCTADAAPNVALFPDDDGLATHFVPAMFGAPLEVMLALVRASAEPKGRLLTSTLRALPRLPRILGEQRRHFETLCDVGRILSAELGLPEAFQRHFSAVTERWDGRGGPNGLRRDALPLGVRIAHVARDVTFQNMLGGPERARRVLRRRAGGAFDPDLVVALEAELPGITAFDPGVSAWDRVLSLEPEPHVRLVNGAIERGLAAAGDFVDLMSPYMSGHSEGVARLASAACPALGLDTGSQTVVTQAAYLHDLGRVCTPARVWLKTTSLTTSDWERIRLHPYYTERFLFRSGRLASLGAIAGLHHERLDGSGYHRGAWAVDLPPEARVLAAADAYRAMLEPRPHRPPLTPRGAADALVLEAHQHRLDGDAVTAVLTTAGEAVPAMPRPAGLTAREAEVVGLLARGLLTKQVAAQLGIAVKTADRHVQNAYRKLGVSTRACATLVAMRAGLVTWGELPMARPGTGG